MATTASGAFPVRLDVAWAMELEQILAHESQHPGHGGETAEKEERQGQSGNAATDEMEKPHPHAVITTEETWVEPARNHCHASRNKPRPQGESVPLLPSAQGPKQSEHDSGGGGELEPFSGLFFQSKAHGGNQSGTG